MSKKRHLANELDLAAKQLKFEIVRMFCWGSTIHGELGLGGIEDENIFIPREIDFKKASDVEQSKIF